MHQVRAPAILVLGPVVQTRPIIRALREPGLHAWTDEVSRAVNDAASLEWADAIVVIDTSTELDSAGEERLREFQGPKLLAASAPLSESRIAALMDDGFDVVIPWPSPPEVVAARIARLVRVEPASGVADDLSWEQRLSA